MLRRITFVAAMLCFFQPCHASDFDAHIEDSMKKYGYKEIQKSNDSTYIDAYVTDYYNAQGSFGATIKLYCNYPGLEKAKIEGGFRNIVIHTQHGVAKIESLCTSNADSVGDFEIANTYGLAGDEEISDETMDLMNTVILKKVEAINAETGKKMNITKKIGLREMPVRVLIKK